MKRIPSSWYADRLWWARFRCRILGHRLYQWPYGAACARCGKVWTVAC